MARRRRRSSCSRGRKSGRRDRRGGPREFEFGRRRFTRGGDDRRWLRTGREGHQTRFREGGRPVAVAGRGKDADNRAAETTGETGQKNRPETMGEEAPSNDPEIVLEEAVVVIGVGTMVCWNH